ncbi:MAG: ribosomal protein S18-alanine N-acetyltransferase [Clostridia bacterium]|nr:ribosomal protein S18-alanine N-acetyltransferase [Clostridia bacterium]
MNNIIIVPTTDAHLDTIAEIEAKCFTTPWSRQSFAEGLANTDIYTNFTALKDNTVVGYICLFHLFEEGELLNVAVSPQHRQQGIAQALLDKAFELMKDRKVTRMTLEVRTSNISAQSLYTKNGFHPIAIRKNYYTSPTEDGIVMEKSLERTV